MAVQDELKQGMLFMKYASNHWRFFRAPTMAFLAGWVQATMIMAVEAANILVILVAPDVLEVILNFIAIAIIADFDDLVFQVIRDDGRLKKLLTDE